MKKCKNQKHDESKFWCKKCGSLDLRGYYTFRGSGVCTITAVDKDGIPYDYEDMDDCNQEDWEFLEVECSDCRIVGDVEEVITIDVNLVKDLKNFKWERK